MQKVCWAGQLQICRTVKSRPSCFDRAIHCELAFGQIRTRKLRNSARMRHDAHLLGSRLTAAFLSRRSQFTKNEVQKRQKSSIGMHLYAFAGAGGEVIAK
jgi:hypothetical protein